MNWALLGFGIFWLLGTILASQVEGVSGVAGTQLNGALLATSSTITVDSTRDFPQVGVLVIDEEIISYTGKTATTFTGINRGARDTKAADHSDNASVYTEATGLVNLALEFKAVESEIPLVGPVISLAAQAWVVVKFVGKIVLWDWPIWDTVILGIPMAWLQYILAIGSISFLIKVSYEIKQIVNPFS